MLAAQVARTYFEVSGAEARIETLGSVAASSGPLAAARPARLLRPGGYWRERHARGRRLDLVGQSSAGPGPMGFVGAERSRPQ